MFMLEAMNWERIVYKVETDMGKCVGMYVKARACELGHTQTEMHWANLGMRRGVWDYDKVNIQTHCICILLFMSAMSAYIQISFLNTINTLKTKHI